MRETQISLFRLSSPSSEAKLSSRLKWAFLLLASTFGERAVEPAVRERELAAVEGDLDQNDYCAGVGEMLARRSVCFSRLFQRHGLKYGTIAYSGSHTASLTTNATMGTDSTFEIFEKLRHVVRIHGRCAGAAPADGALCCVSAREQLNLGGHALFFHQARVVSGDAFSEHSGRHHFCVEIIRIVIPWELQSTERLGGLADVFVFLVLALPRGVKRTPDDPFRKRGIRAQRIEWPLGMLPIQAWRGRQ